MPIQPPNADPSIYGPFPKCKFMGGTCYSFQVTAGWGSQSTLLNAEVVEDPIDNDIFIAKEGYGPYDGSQLIGTPFNLSYSGFNFTGLLKAVDQVNDFQTNPAWKVVLASPVEVLDAAQVVLAGYVGPNNDSIFAGTDQGSPTFQVSNLLNVYGLAEQGGAAFGDSDATQIGLPWSVIASGIDRLTTTPPGGLPETDYGSYLNYRNNYYSVDVSNFPQPPSYYRLGGAVNMSLMDLINQYMTDAGCDYLINLTLNPNNAIGPHKIGFTVIPRYIQQQLGMIPQYIAQQQNIANVSRGQELRSDITQTFLVGDALNLLQPIQNDNANNQLIAPFWGYDINGNPIVGSKPDGSLFADDDYQMVLNGSSVADILGQLSYDIYGDNGIGGVKYPSTILEMRCALNNFDSWMIYIQTFNPTLAKILTLGGAFDAENANAAQVPVDLISDDETFVGQLAGMFSLGYWPDVAQRLYDFVRYHADTYYGKKFIVQLPFNIQIKIDPFNFTTSFNDSIASVGYAVEGEQILGLNFVNENFFLDQTGRFYPFLRFSYSNVFNGVAGTFTYNNPTYFTIGMLTQPRIVNADTSHLKDTASVIQADNVPGLTNIYTRCEVGEQSPVLQNGMIGGGSQIVFIRNPLGTVVPAVVVTIPDAVWGQADDIMGATIDMAAILGMDTFRLRQILQMRSTSVDFGLQPPAIYPNAVTIAIDSSQFVYGPWGQFQANGKLNFEQDQGLNPWNYGGYEQMDLAAQAKLNVIAKGNQVLERGDWTEAGLPKASLGEYLINEGPILTDISCNISVNQVTTNYVMQTFVNRAGAFITENAQRLQVVGQIFQQLRRTMRQLIISTNEQSSIYQTNYAGFMAARTYAALLRGTPHAVIGSNLIYGSGGNYIPNSFTETYQESLATMGAGDSLTFQSSACVGLEAIYRPFTMQQTDYLISPYLAPDSGGGSYDYTKLITSSGLNPFVPGSDFSWVMSGTGYLGMKTSRGNTDWSTVRSVALMNPILQGWGYDIAGNPVPNLANPLSYYDPYIDEVIYYPNPYNLLQVQDQNNFYSGYLQSSIYWPTGPLDLRWNKFTGTWGSLGTILCGEISGVGLSPGGSSYMILYYNSKPINEYIPVANHLIGQQASVPTGTRVIAGYDTLANVWKVIAADCPSS